MLMIIHLTPQQASLYIGSTGNTSETVALCDQSLRGWAQQSVF